MIVGITLLPLAIYILIKFYTNRLIQSRYLDVGNIKIRKDDIEEALVLLIKGLYAGVALLWVDEATKLPDPIPGIRQAALIIESLLLVIAGYFVLRSVRRLYKNT